MSIRIYALAKQLKKESKDLVDVCKKLGLGGKGSPLASLTDEEAEQVSEYFAKSNVRVAPSQAFLKEGELTPPRRAPMSPPPTGKVPVLRPARTSRLSELSRFSSSVKPESEREIAPASSTAVETEAVAPVEISDVAANVVAPVLPSPPPAEESTPIAVSEVEKTTENKQTQPEVELVAEKPVPVKVSEVAVEKKTPVEEQVVAVEKKTPVEEQIVAVEKKTSVEEQIVAVEKRTPVEEQTVAAETSDISKTPQKPIETKPVNVAISETKSIETVATSVVAETPITEIVRKDVGTDSKPEVSTRPVAEKPTKKTSEIAPTEAVRPVASLSTSSEQVKKPEGSETSETPETPVVSKLVPQEETRRQILEEMKRPPIITAPHGDRVRVFGQTPRKQRSDSDAGSSSRPGAAKSSGLVVHLAPLPPQAGKPAKKVSKEPAPQKPEMRLPPEALRAAARGSRPLSAHIRDQEDRMRQGATSKDVKEKAPRRPLGSGAPGKENERTDVVKTGRDGVKPRLGVGKPAPAPERVVDEFGANSKRPRKGSPKERVGAVETRDDVRSAKRRVGGDSKRVGRADDGDFGSDFRVQSRSSRNRRDKNAASRVTAPRKGDVVIETPCTVKQFAEATGISVASVIKKLMELGYMFTLNHSLDVEVVELLIVAFELKATVKKEASLEEQFVDAAFEQADSPESLKPRAPVVTFLGHVDHGKTSLLDRILHLHVVSGEKGGITQHIRAYRVSTPSGSVTFVDTPGHEAFTEMRARGANCTDVAVLVVAADDGVMPQTEEAISHAKAAGVPIVVALNKIDLPGVNRDKVIQELASNDLMPSEWGGDVEVVETSAITGAGVDRLLETLLTVAELHELKANPNRPATGVVLEASMQSGEGVVCKALVQNGTLHNGDVVLCGTAFGRVRSMTDTLDSHKKIKEAGPSVPVSLTGLDVAPDAGSKFVVLEDVSVARQIADERSKRARELELADVQSHVTLENLFERMNSAKSSQTLNVIVRADVRGSIEAIRKEMGKLEHPEVKVKILQASVGGITEADVHLADASDAIIVGFNVVPDEGARALAEKKKVQVRRYDVIYKLTEDIRAALEGMLKPISQVKELGRALVQRAFNISRVGTIAGCRVLFGTIERDCRIRVIRDSRIIGEYQLDTLKREKDDVKEVHDGYECGMKLKNFNDVKEGDVLEAYKIEEIARTF